ncbi:envelope stress sensor histidine kinase CpxA [Caviibacterium pharyngocola]|uniref:histidine kinase n=1 Tax=Caviibacterium pharyngocola TaxID=28159 RepID=A0A2M8RYH7_9PAST|nr:envelope stress sensor histidine kinase CpxA [Caviibacterium pharyngocola]PJG83932.1 two-component system sensor histidine kinase CpxA [Caviibacterium pharyngocola]
MKLRTVSLINALSTRIFALFWLSFLLLFGLAFFLPHFDSRIYSELTSEEVSGYHREISSAIRSNHLSHILSGAPVFPSDKFDGVHPVLVDQKGRILGARREEIAPIQQFMYQSSTPLRPLKKNFYDIQVAGPFIVHINMGEDMPYFLYFLSRVNAQKEIVTFIFDHPLVLIIVIMAISTPLLWWLSRSIGRPLRNLQSAANAVALGDFKADKKLETQGTIELRQVGQSFNRMTDALDDLLSNQQSLLSSISHELRTPLTRLQLALALLRRRVGEGAETARIEKEAERLDEMINDLLLLSRQQLNSHILRSIFPITELWTDIMNDAAFEAEQKNLQFSIKQLIYSPERYYLNGNKGLLTSAVENIVRNALKYTKSCIEATICLQENTLFIAIDDNGSGIPEKEYENIFKPFYRVDEARTRETGGTGLGLAIVANVVKEHQGTVWAAQSHLGGLRVVIRLPLWISQ